MEPDAPLLKVDGLRKSFGRREVLLGVSFEIRPGQIVAIVGENGSGKSTLLKLLAGLLRPDAGAAQRRGTFGYCPQEPLVFDALTVAENIRYFATAYGLPAKRASGQWECWLEALRLSQYMAMPVANLSGGTRQKLSLLVALLSDPDLLLLDEPCAAFDWETYLRFWEEAANLRAQGRAILVVSHLIHDRERVDVIHALEKGTLRCA
jgi:ABC-2 type transport system ATP-binding protein